LAATLDAKAVVVDFQPCCALALEEKDEEVALA
jgi:hypothetical protein